MSEDGTPRTVRNDTAQGDTVRGDNAPGVADIVKNITADVQQLVKGEIELAKAELVPSAKAAGKGAGLFSGAGVLGLYALGLLFIGLSWLIGDALGRIWLGFLIMTAGLLVIAGILALIGKASLNKADFSASRTKAATTETVTAVKGAVASVTAKPELTKTPARTVARTSSGGDPAVR